MFIYSFSDTLRRQIAVLASLLLVISLIYSRAGLSIAQISFAALAVFQPTFFTKFKTNFLTNKSFLATTLIFFITLLSGLYGAKNAYLLERLRMILPFLMLPFAFACLPQFTRRQFHLILYTFVVVLFAACIQVGIHYYLNFETININVGRGQPIPTPINHIRFSLLLAFSILVSGYLFLNKIQLQYNWERFIFLAIGLFQFVFIHVLSVRSGLLVLYLTILVGAGIYVLQTRRYWILALALCGMTLLPYAAYELLPSFRQKINYALWDYKMFQQGDVKDYSDSERLVSLKAGLEVGNQSPIIGIGMGNVQQAIHEYYQTNYPNLKVKMPHNQLLFYYVASGLVGVLIFVIAFLYPVFYQGNYQNTILLALHIIVFLSFMVENTIGRAIGIGFYTFFTLLCQRVDYIHKPY